jgi:hypothetical protein
MCLFFGAFRKRAMLRAHRVLEDCIIALDLLEEDSDPARLRVHWAACCVLLRAVGHVLRKVDGAQRPELGASIEEAWQRWRADPESHAIFWEFIEAERNLLLKEYDPSIVVGEHMLISEDPSGELSARVVGADLYLPFGQGRFEGEDGRDLVRLAIEWWRRELRTVEGT